MTVAPEMIAPVESVTVPETSPEDWAIAAGAVKKRAKRAITKMDIHFAKGCD
jgi:hypothetical protein